MSAFYVALLPEYEAEHTNEQEASDLRAFLDKFGTETFGTAEEARASGGVPVKISIEIEGKTE